MPLYDLPLVQLIQRVSGGAGDVYVGRAVLFPEVVVVDSSAERVRRMVVKGVKEILRETSPVEVHRRVSARGVEGVTVPVVLEAPAAGPAWEGTVELRLAVVTWRHGEEGWVAAVPSLGIEVVCARGDRLAEVVEREARVALGRAKATRRVLELVQLARGEAVEVEERPVGVNIRTPAEIMAEGADEGEKRLAIEEVGAVWRDGEVEPAYECDALVGRVAESLAGRTPRSVLLVGAAGVGKTAVVREVFRRRAALGLGNAPFWSTGGARLIAGASGYGAWQERCARLMREAKGAGAVLHLGNLVELMEVGRAGGGVGIADFVRPYLTRGDVVAVAECTPEQVTVVERTSPQLLGAFEVVRVEEMGAGAVREVLKRVVGETSVSEGTVARGPGPALTLPSPGLPGEGKSGRAGVVVRDEAIEAVERLHRRYAGYSAAPGRPLRFLRNLVRDRRDEGMRGWGGEGRRVISAVDVTGAFAREKGLPLFLLEDSVPLDLGAARAYFAGRVIGQDPAVDGVVDLLATVKARLNRPGRPIASLLFTGPTGVGKTEMAKGVAEFFFEGGAWEGEKTRMEDGGWKMAGEGSAPSSIFHPPSSSSSSSSSRLVRFDMSEFQTPAAVERLVGGGWEREGLLTARVREQPFCVVLLDEFEKAHPAFFDLLLQVLGDGRLTDSSGRVADFSNAIVVMTSNVGAESYQAGPFGLARETAVGAAEHFTEAVREMVRPELFNRIDRVVAFAPLGRETIRAIARRELGLIARREGVRLRELRLEVGEGAVERLAEAGFDPVYGARPLKRRIERDLLAPVAEAVNRAGEVKGMVVRVGEGVELERGAGDSISETSAPGVAEGAMGVRRRAQAIASCAAALAVENELYALRRVAERRGGRERIDARARDRLKRLTGVAEGIGGVLRDAVGLEEELLLGWYEGAAVDAVDARVRLGRVSAAGEAALLGLYALKYADPDVATVAIFGDAPREMFELARAYCSAAGAACGVSVYWYARHGKASLQRVMAEDAGRFLASPRGGVIGVALSMRGELALARFEGEAGLHVFEAGPGKGSKTLLVEVSGVAGSAYRPPKDVEFRVALPGRRRRVYDAGRETATDVGTGRAYRLVEGGLAGVVGEAVGVDLKARVEGLVGEG